MTDDANADHGTTPAALRLNDQLGPLPEARKPDEHGLGWFTAGQMYAYAAQAVDAERERSNLDARRYRKLRARGHSEIPLVVDPVYGEVTYSPAALDELLDDLPDPEA